MTTSKNGYFGLQNSAVPVEHMGKRLFSNFDRYDLANGME
jgi:hypothetical protein